MPEARDGGTLHIMHGGIGATIEPRESSAVIARGLSRVWKSRAPVSVPGASLIERILASRGLSDPVGAGVFLDPKLTHMHDPALLPDMDKAAERILSALRANVPLVIYGDYDVDGITATSILWHTFRMIAPGAPVTTYIPHRIDEGYGLSVDAMNALATEGARVVVSVDCGITAVDAARAARDRGIDLIITDHHNPPAREEDLPPAYAVVHPRRPGSKYPFGDLSGAGVAYKLAWRIAAQSCHGHRVTDELRTLLIDLLALAALGTIADVVPLVGENRVIARFGLARIKHSPLVGLRALVEASGLSGENIESDDVGFKLAPRLNACGRMGHAREAVELLTTAGAPRAKEIAGALCKLNDERRATERRIFDRAAAMVVERAMDSPDCRAIVLAHEEWHAGVVGIVCSRLVERFGRPTLLMCTTDGECHGSGRSIEGFALADALAECSALLLSHGGHDMAAGLRMDAAKLGEFTEAFTRVANAGLTVDQLVRPLWVDADAGVEELTDDAAARLDRLAPFGQGNPRVRVRIVGAVLDEKPATLGSTGVHAVLKLRGAGGRPLRVVGWNWRSRLGELVGKQRVEAVVSPKINTWNGRTSVEAELHDIRVVE